MVNSKLTLNLVVPDAMAAMEFYEKAFGAVRGEVYQFPGRKGANETNVTLKLSKNPVYGIIIS
jgi:uncharacterized glyoxalase superfamily protein PhnB